jgi:hypothetical protein
MNPNFNFNFQEFLKSLPVMDRAETIRAAQREMRAAKDYKVKRADRALSHKQQDYICDLRDFIQFVGEHKESEVPFPEAYLNSDEYKHKLHYRTFGV